MRTLSTFFLFLSLVEGAAAHTLDNGSSLMTQLAHQLTGVHHVPLLVILGIVAIVATRRLLGHRKRRSED